MDKGKSIDWAEVAGEVSHLVRPETRSKYFPQNPLRRFIINHFLEHLAATLAAFKWDTLLDVGCGEGFVDYCLSLRFPDKKITGVEPDPAALEAARKINPACEYIEADGRDLPFPDGSFDTVVCIEVLEHMDDYRKVMEEIRRVSRGPCIISVPAWPLYQGMNFMIGKNWSRLGEHPDHVVQFSRSFFEKELEAVFGASVSVSLSAPWLIGVIGK
jgi:SAM-dependent methyltransferase